MKQSNLKVLWCQFYPSVTSSGHQNDENSIKHPLSVSAMCNLELIEKSVLWWIINKTSGCNEAIYILGFQQDSNSYLVRHFRWCCKTYIDDKPVSSTNVILTYTKWTHNFFPHWQGVDLTNVVFDFDYFSNYRSLRLWVSSSLVS